MKKFVAAEIAELNINETANGLFDACIEVWPVLDKEDKKPVTPVNPDPEVPTQTENINS